MWFSSFGLICLAIAHCLALWAACHALLTKHDPRSALGWIAVLIFLPVAGLLIYLIFGIGRSQSRAEKIMRRISSIESRYYIHNSFGNEPSLPSREALLFNQLANRLSSTALTDGNAVLPLHNGDEAYPAMLRAIDAATGQVFLSSYIFNYGHAGEAFIGALERAHRRGVDVRVIVDGVGAFYSWKKPWKILSGKGVPTARFRPPKLFPPNFGINLRSHRKVLVCDNVGFTGGMNIADGNLLKLKGNRKSLIQDMHFRFEGPVVKQLRRAFLLNWGFCTSQFEVLPGKESPKSGNCGCRVIVDGPGGDSDPLNDLICGAINLARKHVRIMTPYFLPTHDLMASLRSAAQRGVNVWVVLPGHNNLAYISWAMARLLPNLLQAGVRVWEQPPPFAHTKLFTVDGFYSLVGSANMDSRSLRLNFELDMEIYDEAISRQLSDFMDEKRDAGREITLAELKKLSFLKKLRNGASWLFSPYF